VWLDKPHGVCVLDVRDGVRLRHTIQLKVHTATFSTECCINIGFLLVKEATLAKNKSSMANPSRLSSFDRKQHVQVVIETPKGSRNKYAWDAKQRLFQLKKVLPEGMVFPHDFGFIPSTEGEDGDPIDVLILMDQPAFPGCVIPARLIGIIEGEQTEDGKTERNDRLLAVAESSHTHSDVKSIKDLNEQLVREIEMFFVNYHSNDDAEFKVLACKGPKAAADCVLQNRKAA
jgi:inorganic pyrophosphatase